MIEVALESRRASFLHNAAALRGVAAFTEVGKIASQQNADSIRPVKYKRIVDLDVNAEEIEAAAFRIDDIVLDGLHIARGVNAIGKIGLIESAAKINRLRR